MRAFRLSGAQAAALCVMILAAGTSWGRLRVLGPVAHAQQPPEGTTGKRGLHIPRTTRVTFNWQVVDGAGFRWDVQYYGSIGSGTNYAYSGGLYCQVSGSNVSGNNIGWVNEAGDEIEIGPQNRNGLNCYRRVKIYKDQGLARWLDIFENATSAPITVPVRIYSCTNNPIGRTVTSTGGGQFGSKDWAFVTQNTNPQSPAVLHLACGKRSKLRPSVQIQNNQIYVTYNLTVPAGQTMVLCYFESQGNSVEDHVKRMKAFRVSRVLRDLSQSVRKLIVNWVRTGELEGVELDRSEQADTVIETNGDRKFGVVTNASFKVQTLFGDLTLPAREVIGMVCEPGGEARVRAATADGQIVCGTLTEPKLLLKPSVGGTVLQIPFDRVRQWSFRISKQRPEEIPFAGPVAILRTGDRLVFDARTVELKLRTRHGTVDLDGKALLKITMDNTGHAVHRVTFLNGSTLGGLLEPQRVSLRLQIGASLEIPREMVAEMAFALEEREDPLLSRIVLTNEDELLGQLQAEAIRIKTDYGLLTVRPGNIRSLRFSRTHLGWVATQLWDASTHRGQLQDDYLTVRVKPGPALKIHVGQLAAIIRAQAMPPDDVVRQVEKHVAQLGAESYKDREAAKKALIKLGKGILPLLRRHLGTGDPQVRQGVQDVIEQLGGTAASVPAPTRPHFVGEW